MATPKIDAPMAKLYLFYPEQLTIVNDPKDPLYDVDRVDWPVDENLVKSIMSKGFKGSISFNNDGGIFKVVDGRQRVKAALEANKRLEAAGAEKIRIPAKQESGTPADLFGVTVLLNEMRRDDTPLTRAKKAQRLLDMGKTEEEVCLLFGITKATLEAWKAVAGSAPQLQAKIADGTISFTAGANLATLPREKQLEALDNPELQGRGGVEVAKAVVAEHKEEVAASRSTPPAGTSNPRPPAEPKDKLRKKPSSKVIETVLRGARALIRADDKNFKVTPEDVKDMLEWLTGRRKNEPELVDLLMAAGDTKSARKADKE